jgi:transcriptional regulator with XRE-family HTH domain
MTSPPLSGLKRERERAQLTQAQLAETIGCTQSQLLKFESGAVRLDIYRAARLADRLCVRIEDLL